jgi:signal transduction histidine kinase
LTSTNERCNIEISDKGIGIDQSERKKIFEKFYRVGNEDQRKTKGTGLGLYIVDQIVRAHNGSINVSSNQPKGTIFNVFLPFN